MERASCDVCPRLCELAEGAWGFCDVRAAHQGSVSDMYYSAVGWPGILIQFGGDLSWGFSTMRNEMVGEVYVPGCNLKCDFHRGETSYSRRVPGRRILSVKIEGYALV